VPAGRIRGWLRTLGRIAYAIVGGAVLLLVAAAGFLYYEFSRDEPETFFDDPVKQFKYGSTGGEILAGLPVGIFKALPKLCPDYLHGDSWEALGFVYEKGMDRPVGTSLRHSLGFDRIALNCAACHVGTYRAGPESQPVIVPGMPAHRVDLGRFTRFLTDCVTDERFNPWQVAEAAERTGENYSLLQRTLLKYAVVPAMREAVLLLRGRFGFLQNEPEPGPGRFDTFNPEKALLNWPFELLPPRETIGIVDFPSLWLQGPRAARDMHLHWDGNNDFVAERNRSAAFGTGAIPTTLDRQSLKFIADWLRTEQNAPPKYPFAIDADRAATGKPLYAQYCAGCHGASGRDFTGAKVGEVDPIGHIRTDPCRLDNYTHALAAEQGNLYAAYPTERFSHFRKTNGYANLPLDGLWLRGPYLHNGSVPTVRDLLESADNRPKVFYRGNNVVDRQKLGFVSDLPAQNGVPFFRYETQCVDPGSCPAPPTPPDDTVCAPGRWAGNGNQGHEGRDYGTELSAAQKDAIVEYLKTF
jgi:mono/diheme cytochrome c family protein